MTKYWSRDDLVRYADQTPNPARLQKITQHMQKLLDWKYVEDDNTDRFRTFGPDTESALIIADTETSPLVYHTMAGLLPQYDIAPTVTIMPQNDHPNGPVPREIIEAFRATDLVIQMCTYTITHSDEIQKILGNKETSPAYLLLADATEDMFLKGAITADPQEVLDLTLEAGRILEEGEWVEMTSQQGTDVEFSLKNVDGPVAGGGFPFGSTSLCPLPQDSVNGTIVQDSFMMGIGLLEEPIRWEIEDGWITEITGGREADALVEYLDTHGDENSYAFAEFAIVTNPKARPNGNYIENKFVGGAVHSALGDNTTFGGPHSSAIHLDGVLLEPTITVDDTKIIEEGHILFN